MKKIGLTGNAGSGKSTVRSMMEQKGIPTLDADLVAHEIYKRRPDLVRRLQEEFGEDILVDGEINRPTLAQRAFESKEKTDRLNGLVHPAVWEEIQLWSDTQERQGAQLVVIEATLILEAGRSDWYDEIWVVGVDPHIQNQRLLDRGWTQEQIQARLSKQWSQNKKKEQAKVYFDNSAKMEDLESLVEEYLSKCW